MDAPFVQTQSTKDVTALIIGIADNPPCNSLKSAISQCCGRLRIRFVIHDATGTSTMAFSV